MHIIKRKMSKIIKNASGNSVEKFNVGDKNQGPAVVQQTLDGEQYQDKNNIHTKL